MNRTSKKKSPDAPDQESEEEDNDEEDEEDEGDGSDSDEDEPDPYWTTGVDLESAAISSHDTSSSSEVNATNTGVLDALEEGILDLMVSKALAIRLATESARTVLSVDQIIVARQAGGPKPPGQNPNWDED